MAKPAAKSPFNPQPVVIDFDDPEVARLLESSGNGKEVAHLLIKRGGKFCRVWVDVDNFYGRPSVSLVLDNPSTITRSKARTSRKTFRLHLHRDAVDLPKA